MASPRRTGTPATAALSAARVPFVTHEYAHDPLTTHFGAETVAALGIEAARVFKTLVVDLVGGGSPVVCAVVPVSGHLDLKALAHAAGAKRATMAEPAAAQRLTGYVLGGISPLGQRRQLPVYLDASARQFDAVVVSGGRRGLSVEVAPDDLASLLAATYADLART